MHPSLPKFHVCVRHFGEEILPSHLIIEKCSHAPLRRLPEPKVSFNIRRHTQITLTRQILHLTHRMRTTFVQTLLVGVIFTASASAEPQNELQLDLPTSAAEGRSHVAQLHLISSRPKGGWGRRQKSGAKHFVNVFATLPQSVSAPICECGAAVSRNDLRWHLKALLSEVTHQCGHVGR